MKLFHWTCQKEQKPFFFKLYICYEKLSKTPILEKGFFTPFNTSNKIVPQQTINVTSVDNANLVESHFPEIYSPTHLPLWRFFIGVPPYTPINMGTCPTFFTNHEEMLEPLTPLSMQLIGAFPLIIQLPWSFLESRLIFKVYMWWATSIVPQPLICEVTISHVRPRDLLEDSHHRKS